MRYLIVGALLGSIACSDVDLQPAASGEAPIPDSVSTLAALPRGPRDTTEAAVARIRNHFAQIQRESTRYRCVKRELEGFSAEGGELEACSDGEHLRKLTARYYGEGGMTTEEFYIWNDRLEFLFRRSETYTEPLSGIVAATEEHRFYWLNDQLIRWVGPGQQKRKVDSPEASTHATEAQMTVRLFAACALDPGITVCGA